jgi:Cytochrome c oxidase assembly protein COX16
MVLSSFLLTPAAALRYEKHDRMNRAVSSNEALSLGVGKGGQGGLGEAVEGGGLIYNPRRRVVTKGVTSERDEYYVSVRCCAFLFFGGEADAWCALQRLMAKDLDDWEQKRVERWKGEPDGRL